MAELPTDKPNISKGDTLPAAGPSSLLRTYQTTALVAAAFCLVLCAAMVIQHFRAKINDPLNSPQMTELTEKLLGSPKDEQLKGQIRQLDLELRHQYFRKLSLNDAGGWMLLVGVCVLLLSAKQVRKLNKKPPLPRLNPNASEQAARASTLARWSVTVSGATVAIAFITLALIAGTTLPSRESDIDELLSADDSVSAKGPPGPTLAEIRQNWPCFRGPEGNSIAFSTNVPMTWNVADGKGLLWKSPVPTSGFNSPIVWGNHIFLSGGDSKKRDVMCYDLTNGKLLWQKVVENIPNSPTELPEIPEQTGFSAPTMATDGERAYVIFANGDLAAFNFDGSLAWAKNLGVPHNPHGHASSLMTWRDRLIVQLDQGDAEEKLSKLYAFDGASGSLVWQRQRPVGDSWASPIVIDVGEQSHVITLGLPWLMAHDAQEGTEIWRAECLEGEVTPSPVFVNGTLYVVNPNVYLMAIRPDGQGNVTDTHITWQAEDGIPDITSPVSNGEQIFLASTYGVITCYDATKGELLWEHDYEIDFNATPVMIGNLLYLFTLEGTGIVIEAGKEFKEVARSEMGEKVFASPAVVQNRIVVRGEKTLFCIGDKNEGAAKPE